MFNETRLLDVVDYGTSFAQAFNTRITTLTSGHERRNADWAAPLGSFSVMYNALRSEHHKAVYDAHMSCMGRLIGFRFKDWSDFTALDEPLAVGTGVEQTVQLSTLHNFGLIQYTRNIYKPVTGTVTIEADGVPIIAQVNYITGKASFIAPVGSAVTWSGEFDKPVRFESDKLTLQSESWTESGLMLSADVDLLEIRL